MGGPHIPLGVVCGRLAVGETPFAEWMDGRVCGWVWVGVCMCGCGRVAGRRALRRPGTWPPRIWRRVTRRSSTTSCTGPRRWGVTRHAHRLPPSKHSRRPAPALRCVCGGGVGGWVGGWVRARVRARACVWAHALLSVCRCTVGAGRAFFIIAFPMLVCFKCAQNSHPATSMLRDGNCDAALTVRSITVQVHHRRRAEAQMDQLLPAVDGDGGVLAGGHVGGDDVW